MLWAAPVPTAQVDPGLLPLRVGAGILSQGLGHERWKVIDAVSRLASVPKRNRAFVKRWREMWADETYITDLGEDSYLGVHLYAKAARIAGTTDQEKVIEALESGIGMEAPEGWVFMDPATHHLSHYVRLGRCDEKHNISFLNEWPSMEPWWLRRCGVNLVRNPEYKEYAAPEDPYLKKYFK